MSARWKTFRAREECGGFFIAEGVGEGLHAFTVKEEGAGGDPAAVGATDGRSTVWRCGARPLECGRTTCGEVGSLMRFWSGVRVGNVHVCVSPSLWSERGLNIKTQRSPRGGARVRRSGRHRRSQFHLTTFD